MSVPYVEPGELLPGGLYGNWTAQVAIGLTGMAAAGEVLSAPNSTSLLGMAVSALLLGAMLLGFGNAYLAAEHLDEREASEVSS